MSQLARVGACGHAGEHTAHLHMANSHTLDGDCARHISVSVAAIPHLTAKVYACHAPSAWP